MKKITLLLGLFIGSTAIAQTPCEDGMAGIFPCDKFDLQDRLSLAQLGTTGVNDSWGWTDPDNGKEYALVGLVNGTAFVDISDPTDIELIATMPTHTDSSIWRDLKVYNNHVFVVSEAGGHGMQVFDLTRLRDVSSPPVTLDSDAHYNGFGNAHNIVINETSGYAYAVGTTTFGGGVHIIDISDPTDPVAAGGYSAEGYTHDAQVITYNGPDPDHQGKELLIGSNIQDLVIVDLFAAGGPELISSVSYPNVSVAHQGWFTEDQRFFIMGDERDESDFGFNTRTLVFDFNDLDNPQFDFAYEGTTAAIDHNGYVLGDLYILANYSAGMRALDISDIENGNIEEVGFFDTIPGSNGTSFQGTWSVYPYFASGNIILSGDAGLTVVTSSETLSTPDFNKDIFAITPNPAKNRIQVSSKTKTIETIEIYNVLGQLVLSKDFSDSFSETIDISNFNSGMYLVKINNNTTKRLVVN